VSHHAKTTVGLASCGAKEAEGKDQGGMVRYEGGIGMQERAIKGKTRVKRAMHYLVIRLGHCSPAATDGACGMLSHWSPACDCVLCLHPDAAQPCVAHGRRRGRPHDRGGCRGRQGHNDNPATGPLHHAVHGSGAGSVGGCRVGVLVCCREGCQRDRADVLGVLWVVGIRIRFSSEGAHLATCHARADLAIPPRVYWIVECRGSGGAVLSTQEFGCTIGRVRGSGLGCWGSATSTSSAGE